MIEDGNYKSLKEVLDRALDQAANGKGKERHANNDAFEDQVMCYLASQLGPAGPIFQACKKAIEANRLPHPASVNELLGAINYLAGAVIEIERKRGENNKWAESVAEELAKGMRFANGGTIPSNKAAGKNPVKIANAVDFTGILTRPFAEALLGRIYRGCGA